VKVPPKTVGGGGGTCIIEPADRGKGRMWGVREGEMCGYVKWCVYRC
jgi:hypothetical protein